MAYDSESDRVILFGGEGAESLGDTWAYDFNTNTWVDMAPSTAPRARLAHAMAYDTESDLVVLFGGIQEANGGYFLFNDTWTYDFNTNRWTRSNPATPPSVRWGTRMAYDAESDRVILLGGGGPIMTLFNETWSYNVNADTWTKMDPVPGSGIANWHAMAYDTESDRIVRFAGDVGPMNTDETWAYDFNGNAWTVMNPPNRPSARWFHAMAYDQASDRVVLFGGDEGNDETWGYDLNADDWTRLNPAMGPSGRVVHSMAYDAESDRTILFGGAPSFVAPMQRRLDYVGTHNNETWSYDYDNDTWTPHTLPLGPRLLQASPGVGVVELTWGVSYDGGSPVTNYRVYRGTQSGEFALLTEIDDTPAYTDSNVTAGTTYFYRVSAVTAAGEGPRSNEASATTPDLPPTIAITSPQDGETLDATPVEVSGTASDDVALSLVELSTDGTTWVQATLSGSTWSGTLTLPEGPSDIRARATDTSLKTAEDSISVTVEIPPPTPDFGPILMGVAVAASAAAVGVVAFLLWKRRQR